MRHRPSRPTTGSTDTTSGLVFGANPVLELLRAAPRALERVWVVARTAGAERVVAEARTHGVVLETVERAHLDRLSGGGHHQGVAARTRPFTYATLDAVLDSGRSLLVALDGITDPQNLGAIIRSAEVLGAGGLILPRDRSAGVSPAVFRVSSGAAAHLPIALVVNLVRALASAKERGYWIVGLDPGGSSTFQELPRLERVILVVGSEDKGVRPLVREACDFVVRIPIRGRVASLNASTATAIGLYVLSERLGGAADGGRAEGERDG